MSWMADEFLGEMQELAIKVKERMDGRGVLVNGKKRLVYFPHYQDIRNISKVYYEGINKTVFAELFCNVFELPSQSKQKVYDKIVEFAGTNELKIEVMKLLTSC